MPLSEKQHAAADAWFVEQAPDDAPLLKAILDAGERSDGNPKAESPKGARGLMQLTPIALKDVYEHTGDSRFNPDTFNYDDPVESFAGGAAYAKLLRDTYGFTNPLQRAAAYNAGPGVVKEAVAKGGMDFLPDQETRDYVTRVHAALSGPPPAGAVPPGAAPGPPPTGVVSDTASPEEGAMPEPGAAPTGAVSDTGTPEEPGMPEPAGLAVAAPTTGPAAFVGPPAPQAPLIKRVGAGLVRGAAGAADLASTAGSTMLLGPYATNPIPSAAAAVEPYLPARSTDLPGKLAEGAAEAVPLSIGSGPAGIVRGAVAGAGSVLGVEGARAAGIPQFIGKAAERLGFTREQGEAAGEVLASIFGGVLSQGPEAGARAVAGNINASQADKLGREAIHANLANAERDVPIAQKALTEAEATLAAKQAAFEAASRAKVVAPAKEAADLAAARAEHAAAQARVADAERAHATAKAHKELVGENVEGAERNVSHAEAVGRQLHDEAKQSVDAKLATQGDPVERVTTMRNIVQSLAGKKGFIAGLGNKAWDAFFDTTLRRDVDVPVPRLRASAGTIEAEAVQNGLSKDEAVSAASRIMGILTDDKGEIRTSMTFQEAHRLKSELGAIHADAVGSKMHDSGQMYKALAQDMDAALPEDLKPIYAGLKDARTEQARVTGNQYVQSALTDTAQGEATATHYITSILDGQPWSQAKQVEVRALANAAGDEGKQVLGNALVRTAYNAATDAKTGTTDWTRFLRSLNDPEQYRGLRIAFLSADQQRSLLHVAEHAAAAESKVAAARETLASYQAGQARAARTATTLGERATEARRAAAAAKGGVSEAQRAAKTEGTRLAEVQAARVRAAKAEAAGAKTSATQASRTLTGANAKVRAAQKAVADLPEASRSVLNVLLRNAIGLTAGGVVSGVAAAGGHALGLPPGVTTGVASTLGLPIGMSALYNPKNRAVLARAARVSMDSVEGRKLAQAVATGSFATQQADRQQAPTQ